MVFMLCHDVVPLIPAYPFISLLDCTVSSEPDSVPYPSCYSQSLKGCRVGGRTRKALGEAPLDSMGPPSETL